MSETLKNGLLIFIAGLLVVNTYLLISQDDVPYVNPAQAKTTFERTGSSASASDARQFAMDQSDAAKPLADQLNQRPAATPTTTIKFDDTVHDFGDISQNSENTKIFTFTNVGSEPLIIENAKGSCGCTVPNYPREPVAPGETGEIEVVYKPGNQKNAQTKTITITANTQPANTILTVKANVIA